MGIGALSMQLYPKAETGQPSPNLCGHAWRWPEVDIIVDSRQNA